MTTRVLITGAGGPSGVSLIRRLSRLPDLEVHVADIDPNAAGLYLVPAGQRHILLPGDHPSFTAGVLGECRRHRIDVLIPTVDAELLPLARSQRAFSLFDCQVAVSPVWALERCLDKASLFEHVRSDEATCPFWVYDEHCELADVSLPVVAKPRCASGSRGVRVIARTSQLLELPRDGSYVLQEELPGDEYSVDVYVTGARACLAAVPRLRAKVDSGVAVSSVTVRDEELEAAAMRLALSVGVRGVANVQLKRDRDGTPRLLEINPRFPGTMPLTVAAGADMPKWTLDELRGLPLPSQPVTVRALAMVRTWQETFFEPAEIEVEARKQRSRRFRSEVTAPSLPRPSPLPAAPPYAVPSIGGRDSVNARPAPLSTRA